MRNHNTYELLHTIVRRRFTYLFTSNKTFSI